MGRKVGGNQEQQTYWCYLHLHERKSRQAKQLLIMAPRTREPQRAKTLIEKCDAYLETAADTGMVLLASYE